MAKTSFVVYSTTPSPDETAKTIINDRGLTKEIGEFLISTSHHYKATVYGLIYINEPALLDPVLVTMNSLLGNHCDVIESSKL